jgi:deoxycytidylate deaminase
VTTSQVSDLLLQHGDGSVDSAWGTPETTWWMLVAEGFALHSSCVRSRIGAVLVQYPDPAGFGVMLGAGWNPGKNEDGVPCRGNCPRGLASYAELPQVAGYSGAGACFSVHAEPMALQSAMEAVDMWPLKDFARCVMYTTRWPCEDCSVSMQASGIRVVYPNPEASRG